MDLERPLMHAVSEGFGASVYLPKVVRPCSYSLLDWVGAGGRTDIYVSVGRQFPGPKGASGLITAAFGGSTAPEPEALFAQVECYQQRSLRGRGGGGVPRVSDVLAAESWHCEGSEVTTRPSRAAHRGCVVAEFILGSRKARTGRLSRNDDRKLVHHRGERSWS
jgi:hypothetical protein